MFRKAFTLAFGFAIALCGAVSAQTSSPSGTVSIRILRAIDSSTMRPGQAIPGTVVASSNGSVPAGGGAAIQLVSDAAVGFTVQLARLGINGQMFGTKSASAALPNGLPASGKTLSIPANTVVIFTLGEATARGPARPRPGQPASTRASVRPQHPDKSVVDLPPAAPGYPPVHASNPVAQDNCWWIPFESKKFGFEAAVQTCADPKMTTLVTETETGLQWQTLPESGTVQKGQILTVLTKPAGQSIEDAIRQQFVMKLKVPAARTSCKVIKDFGNGTPDDTGISKNNPSIQFYSIKATGPYSKLKKFNSEDATEAPCPDLESNDAISMFFQYNPEESKTKFLFFQEDDNGSILNNDSIHFAKE